jgi:hypothetical protein
MRQKVDRFEFQARVKPENGLRKRFFLHRSRLYAAPELFERTL